jgi:hypothetical protein
MRYKPAMSRQLHRMLLAAALTLAATLAMAGCDKEIKEARLDRVIGEPELAPTGPVDVPGCG